MQLTPRYGADPVISLDGSPAEIVGPFVRQHRRLAAAVSAFDDERWAHPSRCDGWSSRDVIAHLETVNGFWAVSIASGLRGEPTQFLAAFDPVATPAELVAGSAGRSSSEVLDRFVASGEAIEGLLASLDDEGWSALAEAPPGHLTIGALAHHALWDSWVHERDILLPMGVQPDEEADEIAAALRYVAALGPAFALTRGVDGTGVLGVEATGPDVSFVVDIGDRVVVRSGSDDADLRLEGDAVELLEALSIRGPLDRQIPTAWSWMLSGLAETFDVVLD